MQIFNIEENQKLEKLLTYLLPKGDSDMPEANIILDNLALDNEIRGKFIEATKKLCSKFENINNQEDVDVLKKRNFRDFSNFVNVLLILYYSNKEVLAKLKVGSIPPFPEGNYVKEGDIYLLEQVFLKEKIYKV